jgi:hypothetical protein
MPHLLTGERGDMLLAVLIPVLAIVLLVIVLFFSIFKVDVRHKRVKFNNASIAGIFASGQVGDRSPSDTRESQHHRSSEGHHHIGGDFGGGHTGGHHHTGGDFGGGHIGGHF